MMRYTVNYFGAVFSEDKDNEVNTIEYGVSDFIRALEDLRHIVMSGADVNAYLRDEKYGCSLHWDPHKKEFYWEG